MNKNFFNTILIGSLVASLLAGCSAAIQHGNSASIYADLAGRYPANDRPLGLTRLTADPTLVPAAPDRQVFIFVHPAYSLFFRDFAKQDFSKVKLDLMKRQFDHEEAVIGERIAAHKTVILILPGNYPADSFAPRSYVSYLNGLASLGSPVYYLLSETSSTGVLPANDMVGLYMFLQTLNVDRVTVGGGFIGRCQREFYDQFATHLGAVHAFVSPELSTIAPEDVTDDEAAQILSSLQKGDYTPVKSFIDKKTSGKENILWVH